MSGPVGASEAAQRVVRLFLYLGVSIETSALLFDGAVHTGSRHPPLRCRSSTMSCSYQMPGPNRIASPVCPGKSKPVSALCCFLGSSLGSEWNYYRMFRKFFLRQENHNRNYRVFHFPISAWTAHCFKTSRGSLVSEDSWGGVLSTPQVLQDC